MKDIDFDELDKAVSSILGGDKAPISNEEPVSGSEPVSSSSIPITTSATDRVPVSTFNTPKVDPQPQVKADNSVPSTTRRNGRFMDVVHPSSDMSGPANSETSRASLPMTGRTLQPVSEDVEPDEVKRVEEPDDTFEPVGTQMPITKKTDPVTLISTEDTNDTVWPDPLDVNGFIDETPLEVPLTESKVDTLPASLESEPIAPISEATPVIDNSQAPSSPFITDAKVEKRPLGAFSDQPAPTIAPEPQVLLESTNGEDANDQLPPEVPPTIVKSEPLPRELDNDIVMLEGTDPTAEEDTTASDADETWQKVAPTDAPTPPVSGATLSIPQQYKTAERNQKDGDEHPIFDTTEYHAALPAKTKSKSPLGLWIGILTLLIVIVAIAAGVWWFYLK